MAVEILRQIVRRLRKRFFSTPRVHEILNEAQDSSRRKWLFFMRNPRLAVPHKPLIRTDSKIFCMGSCFALEIKKVLRSLGYQVHPYEYDLPVQLSTGAVRLASGRELVHYNTFTILQEFEKAFGLWSQGENDFWVVRRKQKPGMEVFRDPYRREVYSATKEDIVRVTRAFDEVIKKGVGESDLYIFTLGLTEVWRKRDDGRYVCAGPGLSGAGWHEDTEFVQSGFEDNYKNVRKLVELILSKFPDRHIILTVSPVPMARTFSKNDVYTANAESKSVLRAVAGQASREFPNVHYFPAFEMCAALDRFGKRKVYNSVDGRHVRPEIVQCVTEAFLDAYRA